MHEKPAHRLQRPNGTNKIWAWAHSSDTTWVWPQRQTYSLSLQTPIYYEIIETTINCFYRFYSSSVLNSFEIDFIAFVYGKQAASAAQTRDSINRRKNNVRITFNDANARTANTPNPSLTHFDWCNCEHFEFVWVCFFSILFVPTEHSSI